MQFISKSQMEYHTRIQHQSEVSFKHNNISIIVKRNNEGLFVCRNGKSSRNPRWVLANKLLFVENQNNNESSMTTSTESTNDSSLSKVSSTISNESLPSVSIQSDILVNEFSDNDEYFEDCFDESQIENISNNSLSILESAFLRKSSILFDDFYSTFHCMICKRILNENFKRHLKLNHNISISKTDSEKILNLMKSKSTGLQLNISSKMKPFKYITIQNGYECEHCQFKSIDLKVIKHHCKQYCSNSKFIVIYLQNIASSNRISYISVENPQFFSNNVYNIDYSEIQNEFRNVLLPSTTLDTIEQRNHFYVNMGWYPEPTGVDLFNNYDIVKSVTFPVQSDIYYSSIQCIMQFFNNFLTELKDTDSEFISYLNDSSDTGSFKILFSAKANQSYANIFSLFIIFVQRIYSDCPTRFILADEIHEAVQQLNNCLCPENIINLLSKIIRQVPIESIEASMIMPLFIRFMCKIEDNNFMQPNSISSLCSKMIYLIKMTIILEVNSLNTELYKDKIAYLKRNRIWALGDKFNTRGIVNDIRTCAYKFAMNTNIIPKILVDINDRWSFEYNGISFSLDVVQSTFKSILLKLTTIQSAILNGFQPSLKLDLIIDKVSNNANGYKMQYTEDLIVNQNLSCSLVNNFWATGKLNEYIYGKRNGSFIWNMKKVKEIFNLYNEFIEYLLVLIHMVSGMPARGTELATYSISNGPLSLRTVRYSNEQIYFVTMYNKTRCITNNDKPIARFLDKTSSLLLINDILIVRPFIQKIASFLFESTDNIYMKNLFVIDNSLLDGEKITFTFSKIFSKECGIRIKFNDWRQIAEYFGNTLNITKYYNNTNDTSFENINFFEQAGHSEDIANKYYGLHDNESISLREHKFIEFRKISSIWNNLITGSLIVNQNKNEVLNNEVNASSIENLDTNTKSCNSHIISLVEDDYSLELLKKLFGNNYDFKSTEQKSAVDIVLNTKQDLVCILATGSGKSLLFLLKAIQNISLCNVIIVPLISLISDLKQRISHLGISVCDNYMNYMGESILLITPESGYGDNFTNLLGILYNGNQLGSIFIDEAHLFSTDSHYRPALLNQKYLRKFPVPLISLTATCPEWILNDIVLNLYNNIKPVIIHGDTNRYNISYSVVSEKSSVKLKSFIESIWSLLNDIDRIIVYFTSINELLSIEKFLLDIRIQSTTYYSKLSMQEKTNNFNNWTSGSCIIMLATSAFGLGIDYSSVKYVLLYGLPYSIEDYIQMGGRAGRNNLEAHSVLFYNYNQELRSMQKSYHDVSLSSSQYKNSEYMLKYASNTLLCRRIFISNYFDNKEVQCNQVLNCSLCDICKEKFKLVSNNPMQCSTSVANSNLLNQVSIVKKNINVKNMYVLSLKVMLNLLKNKCRLCFVINTNLLDHSLIQCPNLQGRCLKCLDRKHQVSRCTLRIIHRNDLCSQCLLPEYFEDECFHEDGFGDDCYKNVLFEFGIAVFYFRFDLIPETTLFDHYKWLMSGNSQYIHNAAQLFVGFSRENNLI